MGGGYGAPTFSRLSTKTLRPRFEAQHVICVHAY